jgi:uncharacterized protein
MNQPILSSIDKASKVIGTTWPLYSFVASNPLSGYENAPFQAAVQSAKNNLGAQAFPEARLYHQAWERGDIHPEELIRLLKENGRNESPEDCLKLFASETISEVTNGNHQVDRIMVKWLSAFMDEGLAEWDMPFKNEGFYQAWRQLVVHDPEMGIKFKKELPVNSSAALEEVLKEFSKEEYVTIFTYHLAALPGWIGYIKHRQESNSEWQQQYPVSLEDYLAVRLWTAKKLNISLLPETRATPANNLVEQLKYIWLKAWEQSWQRELVQTLEKEARVTEPSNPQEMPDAQMVFCIDTRSELIRRHVESKGNYETFGYAGFFGIAMDYQSLDDGITRKSCPPIVSSAYTVSEISQESKEEKVTKYIEKNNLVKFGNYFLKRMKNMLPSAFGFVEGSGFFYGLSMIARTMLPAKLYRSRSGRASQMESICQPTLSSAGNHQHHDIPLEEKVGIVKSAFDLMGWKQFAPLVLFVGHGGHSANNPFQSSLDCGACAASPGRNNARMLAKLANLDEVRQALKNIHNIAIPKDTVFIGAEHNTTTDEIVLFDAEVHESHNGLVQQLKLNLSEAQQTATQDRLRVHANAINNAEQKASNWAETRPEWGLAKNAGFIIGPRSLTKKTNLDSRCFLHSYDWNLDPSGKALEGIMQGPMVVTQWINSHYYFSTVDNNTYGGGSKITHNITGKFGVVQGNGGDLKMGLPLQSLFQSDEDMYHQPLRLSVLIQAPIARVSEILARNQNLRSLLDNEWIYLMVMDPMQKNEVFNYKNGIQWISGSNKSTPRGEQKEAVTSEVLTDLIMEYA